MSSICALIGIGLVIMVYILWLLFFKKKYCKEYGVSFRHSFNKSRVPLIKLKWNNDMHYFLLDSGATLNILNKNFYDINMNDITLESCKDIIKGFNVSHVTTETANLELSYSKVTFGEVKFHIADLSQSFSLLEKEVRQPIAGLLGTNFLNDNKFKLDFDSLTVWIRVK